MSNKPFSLEAMLRLTYVGGDTADTSSSSSTTSPPPLVMLLSLVAPLAVKVSARHMEKRSNEYRTVARVWSNPAVMASDGGGTSSSDTRPSIKVVRAPSERVEGTPAAAVGVRAASSPEESSGRRGGVGGASRSSVSQHPFGLSSVFSRSSRTCPPPALRAASRQTKAAYDKSKDRTIGLATVRLKVPRPVAHSPIVPPGFSPTRALETLRDDLALMYEPAEQAGRRGLLEFVTTKGGGTESRPSQR